MKYTFGQAVSAADCLDVDALLLIWSGGWGENPGNRRIAKVTV